jgi:hypothetical protein
MEGKLKRIILFLMILLLLVGCGISKEEYANSQEEVQRLKDELVNVQGELENMTVELDKVMGEYTSAKDEIARLSIIESSYHSTTQTLSETQIEYEELSTKYDDLIKNHNKIVLENKSLESQLSNHICSEEISNMKYENILDVSTILAGWYTLQPDIDVVHGTFRNTIWSNTDTKIHTVRYRSSEDGESYVDHFLVYFDEFGWEEGVYWLSEQCWLTGGP